MPQTRSSTRADGSSPAKSVDDSPKGKAGTKRKAGEGSSPPSKRGKKAPPEKDQKTIEETLPTKDEDTMEDAEMIEAAENIDAESASNVDQKVENKIENEVEVNVEDKEREEEPKPKESEDKAEVKGEDNTSPTAANGSAIEQSSERENMMPSNILEKGIIYFFTRGRVGMEEPESVSDLQRSHFVLRPLPKGAKIGDGALEDSKTNRLIAIPKKTLPKGHSDKFMVFVEKGASSMKELKETFFEGAQNETKTLGTRVTPPVTPVGEGIYAITSTDRSTHLVYMLTIPSDIGEVQEDLGLRSQGSFLISVKNPARGGPSYASLPKDPGFPKEIIEEFRGLAWSSVQPKYLNYENAQFLLIGEGQGEDIKKALEPKRKDEKQDKETPLEEMEKLEHEDELRVHHLDGDDSVYADLHIDKGEYPDVATTW